MPACLPEKERESLHCILLPLLPAVEAYLVQLLSITATAAAAAQLLSSTNRHSCTDDQCSSASSTSAQRPIHCAITAYLPSAQPPEQHNHTTAPQHHHHHHQVCCPLLSPITCSLSPLHHRHPLPTHLPAQGLAIAAVVPRVLHAHNSFCASFVCPQFQFSAFIEECRERDVYDCTARQSGRREGGGLSTRAHH